eukprot:162451_1
MNIACSHQATSTPPTIALTKRVRRVITYTRFSAGMGTDYGGSYQCISCTYSFINHRTFQDAYIVGLCHCYTSLIFHNFIHILNHTVYTPQTDKNYTDTIDYNAVAPNGSHPTGPNNIVGRDAHSQSTCYCSHHHSNDTAFQTRNDDTVLNIMRLHPNDCKDINIYPHQRHPCTHTPQDASRKEQ